MVSILDGIEAPRYIEASSILVSKRWYLKYLSRYRKYRTTLPAKDEQVRLYNKTREYEISQRCIPSEKDMTRCLSTTLPAWSRKRSGRNCCGCCQSSGSMCALYRFTSTCSINLHDHIIIAKNGKLHENI